jgi:superfamily II DNA/RNA helicase
MSTASAPAAPTSPAPIASDPTDSTPRPTFADLGVSPQVTAALLHDDITEPFEIQTLVMRDALAGLDILGKSRTGSGKTLAFSIPIVERVAASP